MRIVLFLGAGFSAPFGFPVMDRFFTAATNSQRIEKDEKEFLDKLLLDARSANSFLRSRATNLEDILSFALMGDRLDLQAKCGLTIKRVLQRIYTQVESVDGYWRHSKSLEHLLGFEMSNPIHDIKIITTNYDLVIESILYSSHRGTYPGFEFQQIAEGKYSIAGNLYSKNGLPVFKLHGSANWFEAQNNLDSFTVEGRVVHVGHEQQVLPLPCAVNYACNDLPIIIPPSFLKPEFRGPLQKIWTGAAKAFKEAEIIAFVGYSFPSSDTEMRYFLGRSLVSNPRLRKIFIIDPNAEEISKRLNREDSGYGQHFNELLEIHPANWVNVKLNIQ